jgi:hypothetical protein
MRSLRAAAPAPTLVQGRTAPSKRAREQQASAAAPARAPPSLKGQPRGSVAHVALTGSYARECDFADICALAERIESEDLAIARLNDTDEEGKLIHLIPRSTVRFWLH